MGALLAKVAVAAAAIVLTSCAGTVRSPHRFIDVPSYRYGDGRDSDVHRYESVAVTWKSGAAYAECNRALADGAATTDGDLEFEHIPECKGATFATLRHGTRVTVLPPNGQCDPHLERIQFEGARGTDGWARTYDVCVPGAALAEESGARRQGRWLFVVPQVSPGGETPWRVLGSHDTWVECEAHRRETARILLTSGRKDGVELMRAVGGCRKDSE